MSKNPFGYGLTKRDIKALHWSREQEFKYGSRYPSYGGCFLVAPGFERYPGMSRSAPTKTVKRLLDKGMVYRNPEKESWLYHGNVEVYNLTALAVHIIAETGGYKVRGKRVWKSKRV